MTGGLGVNLDRKPLGRAVHELLAKTTEADVVTVAESIRDDARRMAPRATGRLSRSIEVERTSGGEYIVGWTSAAPYGWLVETGTEDTPPRPHLVPAAIKNGATAPAGGR